MHGVLVAESMRVGSGLAGVALTLTRVRRVAVGGTAEEQPPTWTLLDVEADDAEAGPLAAALAECLLPTGGWYADFHTADESFVVFAGRVFRYPRGDADGRRRAEEHARSVGVPESQLDWAG